MNKDVIYPSMVIRAQEETINKLEDEVNKQAKAIQIYEKELRKHDNNWNELKEFIQKEINESYQSDDMTLDSYGYEAKIILDKIKELESK